MLGVDDFAFRQGLRYGTILVDLEKRQPIDLLPDREAETLALWLKQHPEIEIISRDRAGAYAEGAKKGSPQAKQVADRWHLLKNLGEAVERALQNQSQVIIEAVEIVRQKQRCSSKCLMDADGKSLLSSHQKTSNMATNKLPLTRFHRVHELAKQGVSISKISKQLKMTRMTVYRYLRFEQFPKRAKTKKRGSQLDPYLNYLHQRFAEGCHNAHQLWREVVEQGCPGQPGMVRRYVKNLRRRINQMENQNLTNKQLEGLFATPSARQTAILLLKNAETLPPEDKLFVKTLITKNQAVHKISQLGKAFQQMIREKQGAGFTSWIEEEANCGVKEMAGFAFGLKQDQAAVSQAMTSEWSNGQVEGQVNRLKNIKRQMYGRGNFDLLKARVIHQF